MYNPHLGLINAPPYCCFLKNDLIHYSCSIKMARHILNSGQDFINTCDTGDTSWVILGVILGVIHFLSKRDPKKMISCIRKVLFKRNTF